MEARQHFANEWHNQTVIHPLGAIAVLLLGLALLMVKRRYATWPMIFLACFIPSAQRIVVAGADFDLLRILIIFGTARVLLHKEFSSLVWNRLDTAIVVWTLTGTAIQLVRFGPTVLMNRLGSMYDVLGMYFLFRCLLRDWKDIDGAARGLMYASFPVVIFFAMEWLTSRNVFAVLGGVPAITDIRDGRLRCQGAFSHPILAGCFWAAALPLMATQWWRGRKTLAVAACGAALGIIFACGSATPVFGVMTACLGGLLYWARAYLRWLRWGVVATLIGLHMIMEAPVWHLIARTSSLGGSSWHRYTLLNGAITHFHEWWLLGSDVGTAHWGHSAQDVTNFYIVQCIHGGVVLLALFCIVIGTAFGVVGRSVRRLGKSLPQRLLIWGVGVSFLVHAANVFGVSYFGQVWLSWYLVLAVIGTLPTLLADRTAKGGLPASRNTSTQLPLIAGASSL